MRIRVKSCLNKAVIALTVTVLGYIILWEKGIDRKISQYGSSGPLKYMFSSRLFESVYSYVMSQKCVSSSSNIKVTADYTINSVLDNVKMVYQNYHIEAVDKNMESNSTAPVHKNGSAYIPDIEPLEIIVMPHSHNDPGWKKTYQEYFDDDTTHILSNIVDKLHQYPDMTFIWVESCFLDKWWVTQTVEVRAKFRSLVESGRLEITSGMWVAPDEASPHYFALLDQMIEGHYWVKKHLGIAPESSLNFDQFGYSATMPYLAKKAGLDNILIKRIHRGLKERFGKQQNLNFHWRQFWDPQGIDDIFTHIDTYEWMSISDSCGPDRSVCRRLNFVQTADLPTPDSVSTKSADFMNEFAKKLVAQFRLKTANYKQKVMMLPHGGDFHYAKEKDWDKQYKNLKVFMNYVNNNTKTFNVHMRFGTLKDFFTKLKRQAVQYELTYPVVSGDFYTYTEDKTYWVGYFTTRQFDKRLSRELLESIRTAELFSAIAFNNPGFKRTGLQNLVLTELESARKHLGVFQHHDAITGTSKARVATDYEKCLSSALVSTQKALSIVIEYLTASNDSFTGKKLLPVLNREGYNTLSQRVSIPIVKNGTKVLLMNSLTQSRREVVTLTVQTDKVIVINPSGIEVEIDVLKVSEENVDIKFVVDFPPVSVLVYTLKPNDGPGKYNKEVENVIKTENNYICENDIMNVTISEETGSPKMICYKTADFCTPVSLELRHYKDFGGAYTMITNGEDEPFFTTQPKVQFIKGQTYCSVESNYGFISFNLSLSRVHAISGKGLRMDIFSDLSRNQGFVGDLALRVETQVKSGDVFYVDSNGFQLMGRKFRDSLPFDGNVYPMSSMAILEDDSMRLIVHSAQPHGVVSRTSGKIDFMLDRIALKPEMDLPEGVIDNKLTKTILYLEFEQADEFERSGTTETTLPSINSQYLNDIIQHPIAKFYSLDDMNIPSYSNSYLYQPLPCDIIFANVKNLVDATSSPDGTSLTLFRRGISCNENVENNFCSLYETFNVNPNSLFKQPFGRVTEMSLSHLITKDEVHPTDDVSLEPMDFKTFHLK